MPHAANKKVVVTRSGQLLSLVDPDPAMICVEDIASGLSCAARFNGQTKNFYSVAEHCVQAAYLALASGHSQDLQRKVFLHDAAEAYIGDMTKPLKILMPIYSRFEANIMAAIYYKFGLESRPQDAKLIKFYDLLMLAAEQKHVLNFTGLLPFGSRLPVKLDKIDMWQPTEARRNFLMMAKIVGLV